MPLCCEDQLLANARKRSPNPLRKDPTRTGPIQLRFFQDLNQRFRKLQTAIIDFMVVKDVLDLQERPDPLAFLNNAREFGFNTDPEKLESFNAWFAEQVRLHVFSVPLGTPSDRPWLAQYVNSAYRQGMANAYLASQSAGVLTPGMASVSVADFLAAFAGPVAVSQVRLLYTRAFEELRGITADMAADMSRILAQGLVDGSGPARIAQAMNRSIRGMSRRRGMLLARTEIVRAHAEGQLDSFETLGVRSLGVRAEWSTAGDDRVCPRCAANEGKLFTIEKARGKIPLHPQCRCAWVPYVPMFQTTRK